MNVNKLSAFIGCVDSETSLSVSVLNRNDRGGLILPGVSAAAANRPKTISVSKFSASLGLTSQPDNLGKAVSFLSLLTPPSPNAFHGTA